MSGSRPPNLEFLDAEGAWADRATLLRRIGRRRLDRWMRDGDLVRVAAGTYALRGRADEFATRVNVACHWMPTGAAIGGIAALAMHGLTDVRPTRIMVVAPNQQHGRPPGWIRVLRPRATPAVLRRWGVKVASAEHALVQAWIEAEPVAAPSMVLEALRRSSLAGANVRQVLDLYGRVPRRRQLETLLSESDGGIQSYLERRAHRTVLTTATLRSMTRQHDVVACGKRYRIDAFHAETRTAVEFDGHGYHGTRLARQNDADRDSALATLGILTIRFTYEDVMERPAWCQERITRVILARGGGA